jgi:hypothetical protein
LAAIVLPLLTACSGDPAGLEVGSGEFVADDFIFTYEGQTRVFPTAFRNASGSSTQPTLSWVSSRPDVISVHPTTGMATAVSAGTVVLSANAGGLIIERGIAFDPEGVVEHHGLFIQGERDLEEAALGGHTHLTGDLVITGDVTHVRGLESIRVVGGNLTLDAPDIADTDGLSNLRRIEGSLTLSASGSLVELGEGFRKLSDVGGDLTVASLPALRSLESLGGLSTIGGELVLSNLPVLERVGMAGLTTVGGGLYTEWLTLPEGSPFLPSLREASGIFFFNGPAPAVELSSLVSVHGGLVVGQESVDGGLRTLALPALECVQSHLHASWLAVLNAPQLETVGASCRPGVVLPPPPEFAEDLRGVRVCGNPALPSLDLPVLRTTTSLTVCDNLSLQALDVPILESIEKDLRITGGGALGTIEIPALRYVGQRLSIMNTTLREFRTPQLEVVGHTLEVSGTPLEDLSLPAVERVGNWEDPVSGLLVSSMPELARLDMPALSRVERLEIWGTPELATILLPSLERSATLIVAGESDLADLAGLGGLTEVGFLQIVETSSLSSLSGLSALRTVTNHMAVEYNAGLVDGSMPALERARALSFTGNPLLGSMDLPSLTRIDLDLALTANGQITSLDGYSALRSALNNLTVSGNQMLASVSGLNGIGDDDGGPFSLSGDLVIYGNETLPEGLASALVDYLRTKFGGTDGIQGTVTTGNNGG